MPAVLPLVSVPWNSLTTPWSVMHMVNDVSSVSPSDVPCRLSTFTQSELWPAIFLDDLVTFACGTTEAASSSTTPTSPAMKPPVPKLDAASAAVASS